MEDIKRLIGIGYWHNFSQPEFPDPGWFVDEEWRNEDRTRILAYLQSGLPMPYSAMGVSWCRFRCGINNLGASEFTDGKYVWPEGLPHYINKHKIRLPNEVVDFMLSNKNIFSINENIKADWTWWKSQKGWNTIITTFNDPLDIGILTVVQINNKLKLKQRDFLRKYLLDSYGVKKRLDSIDKILKGDEVKIKGRFKDISGFHSKLSTMGLSGEFQRQTIEEYGLD